MPHHLAIPSALDPSDPIAQLDAAFLESYAARQRAVQDRLQAALACVEDSLILRLAGRRFVGPARTHHFHQLKTICHVPLAIQTILGDDGGGLDETARARLHELSRRADAVADVIADVGLDAQQVTRQRRLLDASRGFIAAVLAAGDIAADGLRGFLRAQIDDIQANIADAACDQLQTMHTTFGAWVAAMSHEQFSQLWVVVGANHMSRTGNLAAQYFTRALGDRWDGRFQREADPADRRILISEAATDEESAFLLLATHAFDRRAANAFFGEESRLGRDVLADATERLLIAMFGEPPQRERSEPA